MPAALESPCWRWFIAVLTVTVFLPAAAHAGCEQVTATLAATVQPQVGPSYVENGYLAIPITPAMAFRAPRDDLVPPASRQRHPSPVRPERHGVERQGEVCPGRHAERAPRRGGRVPAARSVFPIESELRRIDVPLLRQHLQGKGQDGRHPCAQGVRPAHSEGAARAVRTTAQAEEDRFHNGVRHVFRRPRSA